MSIRRQLVCALAVASIAACPPARAAGGVTGVATEMTQMMNNAELAMGVTQQTKIVAKQALEYIAQLEQLKHQMLAGLSTNPQKVISTMAGVDKEVVAVRKYLESVKRAGASVEQLTTIIDQRQMQARITGRTLQEYLNYEGALIQRGDERARQRLSNESRVIEDVNKDLQFAAEQSYEIPATLGTHQAIGLLNKQINRTIVQNARMLTLMAQAQGTDAAEKAHWENVKRDAALQFEQDIRARRGARDSMSTTEIQRFKSENPPVFAPQ